MKQTTFTGDINYVSFWIEAWMCYCSHRLIKAGTTGMRGHEIDYTIFYV
jgi:hypothetical protein